MTERICHKGVEYALVVRAGFEPASTTFITDKDQSQQVGFIVHNAGHAISRHYHRPLTRTVVGMSEVLILKSGRCTLFLYDDNVLIGSVLLAKGDVAVILRGGHQFEMLEATTILEVKQGPYLGADEKVIY